MRTTHTIDAQAKKIGRVATEAAKILMGKNTTAYAPNVIADVEVRIVNASKADISTKKKEEKVYRRYTGYPGGLIDTTMKRMIEKKGTSEVFRIAIKGMLPKNKLTPRIMKNLTITE
ncbi:MAG TPA: 50S ribosomal protein L13 [Thermodesulfobacteriota bacterium]|nr:50S ribosomal protein L13 [Candidatus Paceibacterota bacterium]HVY55171.1 50S ribosomal protein L13 [Thermodesulfobacteriota bacterium]